MRWLGYWVASRDRRSWFRSMLVVAAVVAASGCVTSTDSTTSSAVSHASTTSAALETSTTSTAPATSTTEAVPHPSTLSFSVPESEDGVTFQVDGDPPSGPSSFVVMADGSVVIADTMAFYRGEPRLLHFDRFGEPKSVIDLAKAEVASITDVASDGRSLAVLDILVATNRYRVLFLTPDGDVESVVELPQGYHLENGLTGLLWDDDGVLVEFEFGARYARITAGEVGEVGVLPVLGGRELEIIDSGNRLSEVRYGEASWSVERSTDLGGVTLVGVAPEGSLAVVVDEVDTSGSAITVVRRIQRYSVEGDLINERRVDPAEQFVEINRPLELAADGQVLYMLSTPEGIVVAPPGTS
jgi:hypothetical protein